MINEKLDFYVMEASDEEALKDFWDYCEERQGGRTYNSRDEN